MSSTNRGAVRHPDDFYGTPDWCTWAMVPALERLGLRPSLTGVPLLEPACGEGAILRVLREAWPDAPMGGLELDFDRAQAARDAGFRHVECRDALGPAPWAPACLAMTNPPFSLAIEFARRGIAEGLNTLLLLRLNWLGSEDRVVFHKARPAHIFVLGRRPSFGLNKHGKPGTDACEYGWFGWGPAFAPGRWEMLNLAAVPAHARVWEQRRGGKRKAGG